MRPRQVRHVVVVGLLALRVQVVAPGVPAQVAVEGRADVIQLVEERDELVLEGLVEETRQAERHQVEHLDAIDEVALHAVADAVPVTDQGALVETERGDAGLQTEVATAAGLRHAEQQPRDIYVGEVLAMGDHVGAEPADVGGEVEWLIGWACLLPAGLQADAPSSCACGNAHGANRQRLPRTPAQLQGQRAQSRLVKAGLRNGHDELSCELTSVAAATMPRPAAHSAGSHLPLTPRAEDSSRGARGLRSEATSRGTRGLRGWKSGQPVPERLPLSCLISSANPVNFSPVARR